MQTLIHPNSVEEIEKDSNEKRKEIALSKIGTYQLLESPPDQNKDQEFLAIVGLPSNPHDEIDNAIIYSVYRNAVDFLITEDTGIHKKAVKLNIKDRVLSIDDSLAFFEKSLPDVRVGRPPALKEDLVYNLDINDPIFDTLKKEYPDFEEWFAKISREGRKCWVHRRDDNSIGALLILKPENEPIDSIPPIPQKSRLKICTLIATFLGRKIGELFIRLSIEYAVKNNLSEMYLTHFTKQEDRLVDLISEYGFNKVATK
ncbi:MAG: hypothetical protein GXO65_02935, partial [Euryarchaeota archaeon]|nr:hypothetical protein [Euryarchaeota archaeon]